MLKVLMLISITILLIECQIKHYTKEQVNEKVDNIQIKYGSPVRIKANMFLFHLHSSTANYPGGSGYQSVSGVADDHHIHSLWIIKQAHQERTKNYEYQVKCGETIRLQNVATGLNLHSEQMFESLITKGQEVSAYGNKGIGNEDDNWVLKCIGKVDGEPLTGKHIFELFHQNTEKYLKMSRYYQYTIRSWDNCPIQGQLEVCAVTTPTKQTQFKIVGGLFFQPKNQTLTESQIDQQL